LTLLQMCALFAHGEAGVFHWDGCCFVSGLYPNSPDSSPVMMLEIKLGPFSAQFRQQCIIPFDHCSSALAHILLQCASCWACLTDFAGTFYTTVRQCCKHRESSPVFQDSLLHFCHIFVCSSWMSFRTLLIDWHPSILETLKPFLGWSLAQGFITLCFCKHFVCFCSHLPESEAEFDADPLLPHISHFSRLVHSQDSTNRMSEKCTEKNTSSHTTTWQAGSQRVQLAIPSGAQLYYKRFLCDIQILGTFG
jgi:hypothetical protein